MIVRHSNGLPSVALYRELMSVRASSSTSVMASTRSQPAPWHRTHLFRSFLPVPLHCRHCCHSSGITTRNTPLHRRARRAARGASHVCPMADLERVKAPQPVQTATGLEIGSGISHLPLASLDQMEEPQGNSSGLLTHTAGLQLRLTSECRALGDGGEADGLEGDDRPDGQASCGCLRGGTGMITPAKARKPQ